MPRKTKQQANPADRPVTVWFHLALPATSTVSSLPQVPTGDEWASVLKIPSEQHGLRHSHWGMRLEDPKKAWLVLEWSTMAELDNFKKTEAYTTFLNGLTALVGDPPAVYHIHHIGHWMLSGFFRRTVWPRSQAHHEVLTVYFPVKMTPELKTSIELKSNLDSIGLRLAMMETGIDPALIPKKNALEDQNLGWVEEKLMWEGKRVRGLRVLWMWSSEEGERLWKQEERGGKRHATDKELPLAIDLFFQDMRECGMLGFESYHGGFIQI
ncbi:hypothetical protein MMC30_005380 [Trapelia coarctata]|nr:hypothetical protein [Trapelia coarctata]